MSHNRCSQPGTKVSFGTYPHRSIGDGEIICDQLLVQAVAKARVHGVAATGYHVGDEQGLQGGLTHPDGIHDSLREAGRLQVKHLGVEEHLRGQALHGGQLHVSPIRELISVFLISARGQALKEVYRLPEILWHVALVHLNSVHRVQLKHLGYTGIFQKEALAEIGEEILAGELQHLKAGL